MPDVALVEVEESVGTLATLVRTACCTCNTCKCPLERVALCSCVYLAPVRCTTHVHGAYRECVVCYRCKVLEQQLGVLDGAVYAAVEEYLVIIGTFNLLPAWSHCVCLAILIGNLCLWSLELALVGEQCACNVELVSIDGEYGCSCCNVSLCNLYHDDRVLYHLNLLELAALCGKTVEVGLCIVEPYVLAIVEILYRSNLLDLHALFAILDSNALWSCACIDLEHGYLLFYETVEVTLGRVYSNCHVTLCIFVLLDGSGSECACTVELCHTVVIVLGKCAVSLWVEFVHAQCLVHLLYVVVWSCHWNDGTCLYEYRELPQWSLEVVDDATALVSLACEPVVPCALGQVDVVTYVVAVLLHCCVLVDRSNKEIWTVHVLVACCCTQCKVVCLVLEEHCAYHWLAVNSLACDAVCVWHELRLHLHVCTVD